MLILWYDRIFRDGMGRESNFSNVKFLKKLFQCQVSEDNIVPVLEIDTLINTYDNTYMFLDLK